MEVGRSVQGQWSPTTSFANSEINIAAVAYVPISLFSDYHYQPLSDEPLPDSDLAETHIEINLDTLLTCLEIFTSGKVSSLAVQERKQRSSGGGLDDSFESTFGPGNRTTALQLTYAAFGEPLTLLCALSPFPSVKLFIVRRFAG